MSPMDLLYRRVTIRTIDELHSYIEAVSFEDGPGDAISAMRANCCALLAFLQSQNLKFRRSPAAAQLREEALKLVQECDTLKRRAVRPGASFNRLRDLYEGLRVSVMLVCQQLDPTQIDSLAEAL